MATDADRVVLKVCALCVRERPKARKSDYLALLQSLNEAEIAALMDLLQVREIKTLDLLELLYKTDWKPFLQERSSLVADAQLLSQIEAELPTAV